MNKNEVIKMIELLTSASASYYNLDEPLMSDEEYDTKLETLETLKNEQIFPELFIEGSDGAALFNEVAPGLTKLSVEHNPPMLSLEKAKKNVDLEKFLTRLVDAGAENFKIQAKLDGMAMKAVYEKDKLVQLATRGTATHGEDVSFALNNPLLAIIGLPKEIKGIGNIEIRGELFLNVEQFNNANYERIKLTGTPFNNSRNAGAGLLKKAEKGLDFPVEFTFSAYTFIKNGQVIDEKELKSKPDYNSNINGMLENGLITTAQLTNDLLEIVVDNLSINEIPAAIEGFGDVREGLPVPTDGVVIKPMNEAEMFLKLGVSTHHPKSQIAWKYPAEKATTVITSIDYSVGKTGRITPRAVFNPVVLDGSTVEYASLHNFNNVNKLDVRVGSKVIVEKANEIIPQVVTVVSNPVDSKMIEVPTVCPVCEGRLVAGDDEFYPKTISCVNETCPSRVSVMIKVACGRQYLDIDGMGEVIIKELTDNGTIKTIADLYKLDFNELANTTNGYNSKTGTPRRLGEKTAKRILDNVERSKTIPQFRILAALNIKGLGKTNSKKLLKMFTVDELRKITIPKLETIDGFSFITAEGIVKGLKENSELIDELISLGVELSAVENNSNEKIFDEFLNINENNKLNGLSFNISGAVPEGFKNRGELVEWIENNGGVFHSAPKKTTDYVIGDVKSSSSKIKKAVNMGLTIISPEEFNKNFNN